MTTLLLLIFGLLGDCLLSVLVGLVGARRKIGFGWTFLLSAIFTPVVGIIAVLLSDPLPQNGERRWGCLGSFLAIIAFLGLALVLLLFFGFLAL